MTEQNDKVTERCAKVDCGAREDNSIHLALTRCPLMIANGKCPTPHAHHAFVPPTPPPSAQGSEPCHTMPNGTCSVLLSDPSFDEHGTAYIGHFHCGKPLPCPIPAHKPADSRGTVESFRSMLDQLLYNLEVGLWTRGQTRSRVEGLYERYAPRLDDAMIERLAHDICEHVDASECAAIDVEQDIIQFIRAAAKEPK